MSNVRITPFEGNYYIRKKYLKTDQMRVNYFPGLCIYKFLYVWMDLHLGDGTRVRSLGWMYWLPNPFVSVYLISGCVGEARNRTTDTRIFSIRL